MKYFGGDNVYGDIRALRATDFKDFVSRYIDAPVELSVTREDYHTLTPAAQFEAKNKSFFCCCQFKAGTTQRKDINAETMVLISLDLDHDEDTGHNKIIADNPQTAIAMLHPWNCAIYHTASSTQRKPRLRIVVDADYLPLDQYGNAVRTIASKLGIPDDFSGVKESSVVSQPMFRPVIFKGEENIPVIGSRVNGRAFTPEEIETFSDSMTRSYAWSGTDDPAAGLDQLPLPGITIEDIRPAVEAIDPDVDRSKWITVAAALKHQFRSEDQAQEAYQLFDEWSSKGTKYQGEKDTYTRWKSFRPDAVGKRCVTIRSLLHLASEHGWKPERFAHRGQQIFQDWVDEQDDYNVLIDEGIKRIAAHPYKSATMESLMLAALHKRIKKFAGTSIKMGALEKDLKKVRFEKAKDRDDSVPNWLRPWAFCQPQNEFVHIVKMTTCVTHAFNMSFARDVAANEEGNKMPPSVIATEIHPIPVIDGMVYDPRFSNEIYFDYEGKKYLNVYRLSSAPEPVKDKSELVGQYFVKHLRTLLGEEEYVQHVLHFIAHMVQRPGVKIRWIPLVQSAQGAGKNILADMIGAAIGMTNYGNVSPNVVFSGPWNDWAVGKQFLLIDELRMTGKNRHDMANRLKDFITNNTIAKVEKFKNSTVVQNICNAIAFTNYKDAIPLDESNRRYMPIFSPLQHKSQVVALTENGHFKPLDAIIKKHGGALRQFLLDVEIPEDFPVDGPAPKTPFAEFMVEESKNVLQITIEESFGSHPLIAEDLLDENSLSLNLTAFTRDNHRISHYLHALGFVPHNRRPHLLEGGQRVKLWYNPQLFDARLDDPLEIAAQRLADSKDF